MAEKCDHCSARLFKYEKKAKNRLNKCCANGKVDLSTIFDELQDRPEPLATLFETNLQFVKNSRKYNSELALASIRSTEEPLPANGPQPCKMNGDTYYNASDLIPPNGRHRKFA